MAVSDSTRARFWSKVRKSDGCWEWVGGRKKTGYGHFSVGRETFRAHRLAFEWANGPIAQGLIVCHRCDNPSCVRPDHLFIGTHADNVRDRQAKGRNSNGRTSRDACLYGHPYDEANTAFCRTSNGARRCRKCTAATNRAYRRRKAAGGGK